MDAKTKNTLEEFVRLTKRLGNSKFLDAAKTASMNLMPKGPQSPPDYKGPDDEEKDAFILRLRFFIQNNEQTSLQNVSGLLHATDEVSEQLKQDFDDVRQFSVLWKGSSGLDLM